MSLLARVVSILDQAAIPHCVIGATAAAMHGIVRATLDVDLLTTVGRVLDRTLWESLAPGADIQIHRGDLEDSLLGTVRITQADESPIDVVVGAKRWMEGIVGRSEKIDALGTSVGRPQLADLVLLKLDAGSIRDLVDVREMHDSGVEPSLAAVVEERLAPLPNRYRRRWEQALKL